MVRNMFLPLKQVRAIRPTHMTVFTAAVLLSASLSSCNASDETSPSSTGIRPRGVKPRLSFSPSAVESCATSVVTLECSTRHGRTFEARIATPEDDGTDDGMTGEDNVDVQISTMTILKRSGRIQSGQDEWEVFAELGDSESPTGPAVADPGVEVTGKVGGSAEESHLRVIWDLAGDEIFGAYRCDVMAAQTAGGNHQVSSSEPVTLENPNGDGERDEEEEILRSLRELKAERQKDIEWRENVDKGLERISSAIKILDQFARGNAYKLNRIFKQLANITTTIINSSTPPTAPATTTTTTTTAAPTNPPRTFAPPPGDVDPTMQFVLLSVAAEKPTGTLLPDTGDKDDGGGKKRRSRRQRRKDRRREKKKERFGRDTRERQLE